MNKYKLKYLLLILVLLTSVNIIGAQVILNSYIDIGENNASEGVYVKNVYRGSYQFHKYTVESGVQFDIKSNSQNTFTGFDIIGSRKFLIGNFPFDVKGFFMLNRFSDILHETNYGLRIETRKFDHFLVDLGINNKAFTINSSAREQYDIDRSNSTVNDNFNVIYVISAYLKPHDNDWNVGLSFTNVDFYIINQSNNPVYNLQMMYKLKSNLTLNLDAWYKQSGIFNISANHFGYFFRGGVKWKI